eukprot:CAMPEP_0185005540 /NCGR_PEP_ID=MMETSP1098-20130426/82211_1 /TAXON_ID=89044 /ORGANISM="Spumella elongata, Strain CCAP 955/1" /LENGTH=66 /DNA_ID=CAMNT_0027533565 /DNA_START=90 /DNA_END=286 /DNA_ORIENTATION=+
MISSSLDTTTASLGVEPLPLPDSLPELCARLNEAVLALLFTAGGAATGTDSCGARKGGGTGMLVEP